jgi:multidrug efflux pump subunit AcrB
MLTSLTTFLGLVPMLLEHSSQAQFMVPMAISLAFGIMFATVITLLLVPSLYMMLDDLNRWWSARTEQHDGRVLP